MLLLGGLEPGHLRSLDQRLAGALIEALRRVLEADLRPELAAWWVRSERRWKILVRGLDSDDAVRDHIELQLRARPETDLSDLGLIHLAAITHREELVGDVFGHHEKTGSGPWLS